jgi:hypothetical protein
MVGELSESRIEPAGVEHPLRVEGVLELAVDPPSAARSAAGKRRPPPSARRHCRGTASRDRRPAPPLRRVARRRRSSASAAPRPIRSASARGLRAARPKAATGATAARRRRRRRTSARARSQKASPQRRRSARRRACRCAAATAAPAPDRRSVSTPSNQAEAEIGSGWPPHWFSSLMAWPASSAKRSVSSRRPARAAPSARPRASARACRGCRHQARDIVAGDVLHHLAAEGEHLAQNHSAASRRARNRAPPPPPAGAGRTGRWRACRRRSPPGRNAAARKPASALSRPAPRPVGERRAGARRHHQFGRLVGDDAPAWRRPFRAGAPEGGPP